MGYAFGSKDDWTSLAALIPDLKKNKVLSSEALEELELQVSRELLMLSLPAGSLDVLKQAWNGIPKSLRQHPRLVAIYAAQLIKQNQMNEAETLLRDGIKRGWDSELVELYGRVRTDKPDAQLASAETWLRDRPEDPSLLLTLGRLSLQNQLWGKARSYLESSLKRRPMAQTYGELAALMGQLGEADKAFDYYRCDRLTGSTASVEIVPSAVFMTELKRIEI